MPIWLLASLVGGVAAYGVPKLFDYVGDTLKTQETGELYLTVRPRKDTPSSQPSGALPWILLGMGAGYVAIRSKVLK